VKKGFQRKDERGKKCQNSTLLESLKINVKGRINLFVAWGGPKGKHNKLGESGEPRGKGKEDIYATAGKGFQNRASAQGW